MSKKIGLILVSMTALILAYNLIGQISSSLKSGERLDRATENLHSLEIKNKELKERLEEVKSRDFIEGQARDKLGLAKDGETVVVIPQEKLDQVLGVVKKVEEIKLPNWQGWLKLFWH